MAGHYYIFTTLALACTVRFFVLLEILQGASRYMICDVEGVTSPKCPMGSSKQQHFLMLLIILFSANNYIFYSVFND